MSCYLLLITKKRPTNKKLQKSSLILARDFLLSHNTFFFGLAELINLFSNLLFLIKSYKDRNVGSAQEEALAKVYDMYDLVSFF